MLALTPVFHRHPRWGLDPDEFDPDLFAAELVKGRPAGLYKLFGIGERSCIGRQFALHEAVLILGALIRRYDLIADPNYELQIAERLLDATRFPSRVAVAVTVWHLAAAGRTLGYRNLSGR